MANETMIDMWNNQSGAGWVTGQERMDRQLEPIGRLAIDALVPATGERLLDIGCGTGATTLALADAVGRSGTALGLDISAPMLALARSRASDRSNVQFMQADAQTYGFEPASFDGVFSRFGVMFFDDPVGAFANIRRALKPKGRLAFVCWQSLDKNRWMGEWAAFVADLIPPPPPPPPDAPGPFAFGDPARVRSILEGAGWRDVKLTAHNLTVAFAQTVDEVLAGVQEVGPLVNALREAKADMRAAVLARIETEARTRLASGGLTAPAAVWVVTGRS